MSVRNAEGLTGGVEVSAGLVDAVAPPSGKRLYRGLIWEPLLDELVLDELALGELVFCELLLWQIAGTVAEAARRRSVAGRSFICSPHGQRRVRDSLQLPSSTVPAGLLTIAHATALKVDSGHKL